MPDLLAGLFFKNVYFGGTNVKRVLSYLTNQRKGSILHIIIQLFNLFKPSESIFLTKLEAFFALKCLGTGRSIVPTLNYIIQNWNYYFLRGDPFQILIEIRFKHHEN